MGKIVLITGINSYFASTLLPRLDSDPAIDKIIGIDITPWKGGYHKVDFYKVDIQDQSVSDLFNGDAWKPVSLKPLPLRMAKLGTLPSVGHAAAV